VKEINIEYVDKLHPIFTKPKRIKIIVGGRGSTKSTGVADHVDVRMMNGELWCCAREHQNSIEESVHRTLLEEIGRLELPGFTDTKTSIDHSSGGRTFYRGLARNITSLKSTLSGVDGLWIEEGEDLSDNTLRVLTASVRLNATDTQRAIAGEDVKMPEIIITMNRGSRSGAVAKKWLVRAEKELAKCGYYEDDLVMIVEMNYTDMPKDWFELSGLEQERADDYEKMSRSQYDHKWHGKYLESVDNPIILPEWFDACIDAHTKLGWKITGKKIVSHDPSDCGPDDKGLAYRHGSVFYDAKAIPIGDVNEGLDAATDYAIQVGADEFNWDGDGLGLGLRRDVAANLKGKNIEQTMFRGSEGPENPDVMYQMIESDVKAAKPRSNKDTFLNKRSQYYIMLADRMYRTYQAVEKGVYHNPDEMISFSSDIEELQMLRSELTRIPKVPNGAGKIQIMSKKEMKTNKIDSPNMGDAVMMSMAISDTITVSQVYIPPVIRPKGVTHGSRRY